MEGFIYFWVEGYNEINDFCQKRLGERPQFVETIGHCGNAKIYNIYKIDKEGKWHNMYFVFMRHKSGTMTYYELMENIYHKYKTYEQIGTDRNSLLKRRGGSTHTDRWHAVRGRRRSTP